MNRAMPYLAAIVFCLMFFGASLWEKGNSQGIILVVIGALLAIPMIVYQWKREEHI